MVKRGRGRPPKMGISATSPSTPASQPPSQTKRRSLRGQIEIKDSSPLGSELELDEQSITVQDPSLTKTRASHRLSEVRVPLQASNTRSPSTVSSVSARHDRSGIYDTPATSAAATPAELKMPERKTRARGSAFARELARRDDTDEDFVSVVPKKSKGKQKAVNNSTEDHDELLARTLQSEEFDAMADSHEYAASNLKATNIFDEFGSPTSDQGSQGYNTDSEPLAKRRKGGNGKAISRIDSVRSKRNAGGSKSGILPDSDEDSELSTAFEPTDFDASDFEVSAASEAEEGIPTDDEDADDAGERGAVALPVRARLPLKSRRRRARDTSPGAEKWTKDVPGWQRKNRYERDRIRTEHYHPDIITLWDDLEKVPVIKPVRRPQPTGISRELKPFQLEGVDWMLKQEQTHYKGGLLGDEMGMGKTIQAVSLIMSDYPAKNPTLVVVPPVALVQWSSEISSYTDGKLKVLIHHNTDPRVKKMTDKDLRKYDVIMISYSGLESIYRKEQKGWKRGDELVKANSRIHAITYHRVLLDEAHNIKQRTTGVAQACFALKADYKWCLSGTPVQNRIGEFFSLLRFLTVKPFACYFCKRCECAEIHWEQDSRKLCKTCHHTGFNHFSIFNKELLDPITYAVSSEKRKEAMKKLRLLTDRIMLRRMKKDHTASMELPAKQIRIHNEFFGDIERDFSSSIMSNTTRQFDTYVSRGVMLNNYANIFGLIMQMRQVANHPDLILKKKSAQGQNVLVCCICDEAAEEAIRSRCRHEFCRKCARDYIRTFDEARAGGMTNSGGQGSDIAPDCPRCHIPLSIDFEQPDIEQDEDVVSKNSIINRINMDNWTSSTKIEMLIYDLYKLRKPYKTAKSIVFSQFTSMLQLVEWRLRKAGISTVMLDGSMSPAQRQKSIEYFMNNVHVEVFLVSLKAGGVALNLTEASKVFIVDPWWNPAAEHQSADRCHRIGQRRACTVTRLVIEDSVESRMVLLQEKKSNMIAGTVDGDDVAIEKLTPEDMGFLFRSS